MTVNQRVSGSSPEGGAKENQALTEFFVSAFCFYVHTNRIIHYSYNFQTTIIFNFYILCKNIS
jgi:hypothetical protein